MKQSFKNYIPILGIVICMALFKDAVSLSCAAPDSIEVVKLSETEYKIVTCDYQVENCSDQIITVEMALTQLKQKYDTVSNVWVAKVAQVINFPNSENQVLIHDSVQIILTDKLKGSHNKTEYWFVIDHGIWGGYNFSKWEGYSFIAFFDEVKVITDFSLIPPGPCPSPTRGNVIVDGQVRVLADHEEFTIPLEKVKAKFSESTQVNPKQILKSSSPQNLKAHLINGQQVLKSGSEINSGVKVKIHSKEFAELEPELK